MFLFNFFQQFPAYFRLNIWCTKIRSKRHNANRIYQGGVNDIFNISNPYTKTAIRTHFIELVLEKMIN